MNKEDVKHLSHLARIELTEAEADNFAGEISAIVSYVGVIQDIISSESEDVTPKVGVRFNVFRKDVVTNEPDSYTKDILAEMPKTQNRYLVVKKILKNDSE
ncbi:MAG: Asp-tRNA(Asn)/Glu-tRNA(Gln) amidotransferase subunit GatC [Candidatus Pacebacteria bacterium]|nr:Asp-tRNA(Asn)/Glu-tRNA(Gln) amidotransferase subunit GatC [Candidatus Paceibacterota bacterium]